MFFAPFLYRAYYGRGLWGQQGAAVCVHIKFGRRGLVAFAKPSSICIPRPRVTVSGGHLIRHGHPQRWQIWLCADPALLWSALMTEFMHNGSNHDYLYLTILSTLATLSASPRAPYSLLISSLVSAPTLCRYVVLR